MTCLIAAAKSTRSASPADKLQVNIIYLTALFELVLLKYNFTQRAFLSWQVDSLCGSKCALNVEDSISSFKCMSPRRGSIAGRRSRSLSKDVIAGPDFAGSSRSDTNISGRLLQHDVARPVLLDSENFVSFTEIWLELEYTTYLRFLLSPNCSVHFVANDIF